MQINTINTDQSSAVRQVPGQFANFDPGKKPAEPTPAAVSHVSVNAAKRAELESVLAQHNISLQFSTDDTTKALVVRMVDGNGEEVRQFPSAVSLALAANFIKLQGQFVDKSE